MPIQKLELTKKPEIYHTVSIEFAKGTTYSMTLSRHLLQVVGYCHKWNRIPCAILGSGDGGKTKYLQELGFRVEETPLSNIEAYIYVENPKGVEEGSELPDHISTLMDNDKKVVLIKGLCATETRLDNKVERPLTPVSEFKQPRPLNSNDPYALFKRPKLGKKTTEPRINKTMPEIPEIDNPLEFDGEME